MGGINDLRSALAGAPAGVTVHVAVRRLTCPFGRLLALLEPGASVLDVGAGHGLLAALAVRRAVRVVAVEPDLRKVAVHLDAPGAGFVAGFDQAVAGSFDAVTLVDVLYRVPREEWDGMLARLVARLKPGGRLLLKEIDPTRPLKQAWNRAQERLADALHLTYGPAFAYERPEAMLERLRGVGLADVRMIDVGRGYPHAHVLYVGVKR